MLCCDWLQLIFPPKILAIVLEFLRGKDKRVQELFDSRETTCELHPYEYYKGTCHDLVSSSTFR